MVRTFLLVVDDSELYFRGLRTRLGRDHACLHAHTVEVGLKLARTYRPVVVLLDIYLGDQVSIERIPEFAIIAPVVAMSGLACALTFEWALELGAVAAIAKGDTTSLDGAVLAAVRLGRYRAV